MTKASVTLRQMALFDRKYSWLGGIAEQVAALEEENARLRAEQNPVKTYKDVLLERFPKARIDDDGEPLACRKDLFSSPSTCVKVNPYKVDCARCWNEPYKEDEP